MYSVLYSFTYIPWTVTSPSPPWASTSAAASTPSVPVVIFQGETVLNESTKQIKALKSFQAPR